MEIDSYPVEPIDLDDLHKRRGSIFENHRLMKREAVNVIIGMITRDRDIHTYPRWARKDIGRFVGGIVRQHSEVELYQMFVVHKTEFDRNIQEGKL